MLDICMDSNEQTCAHAEKLDSTMDTCLDSHVDTSKKCCKDHANIWLDSERKIPGHRNMDTSVDTSVDSGDSHCMGLPDNHKSAEPVPGNQSSLSGKETCTCQSGSAKLKCRKLGNFLEEEMSADHITQFLLPKKVLSKFALVLGEWGLFDLSPFLPSSSSGIIEWLWATVALTLSLLSSKSPFSQPFKEKMHKWDSENLYYNHLSSE